MSWGNDINDVMSGLMVAMIAMSSYVLSYGHPKLKGIREEPCCNMQT